MPSRVDRVLSQKPVKEEDLLAAMNWEILPALRALLDAHNNSVGPATMITEDVLADLSTQFYLVDTSSSNISITLPPAQGWTMPLFIRALSNANIATVIPNGSDEIEGANASQSANIFFPFAMSLISDGDSGWWFL